MIPDMILIILGVLVFSGVMWGAGFLTGWFWR